MRTHHIAETRHGSTAIAAFAFAAICAAWWTSSPAIAQSTAPPAEPMKRLNTWDSQYVISDECGRCHFSSSGGSIPPDRVAMGALDPEHILAMVNDPATHPDAQKVAPEMRFAIVEFIAGRAPGTTGTGGVEKMKNVCAPSPLTGIDGPGWNGWSPDVVNTRYQPVEAGKLTAADLPRLKLKWAFGMPNAMSAYGQPTVAGGRVFVGSDTGYVYALNAKTGCVYWAYQAQAGVRTAPNVAPVTGHDGVTYGVFFADQHASVYGLDASTGKLLWTRRVEEHPEARITSALAYWEGRLYAPVGNFDKTSGSSPLYQCCDSRGSVVALDASTGAVIWKSYTTDPARPTRKTSVGTQLWGPGGVTVWTSPTLDVERNALYVGTSGSANHPTPPTTDAVMAFAMDTGRLLWFKQFEEDDAYIATCPSTPRAGTSENCPNPGGPNHDVSASMALQTLPDGRDVIIASQKSGEMYELDPDRRGRILWKTTSQGGGLLFGYATDNEKTYVALQSGEVVALRNGTGERVWKAERVTDPANPRVRSAYAAAATLIPGAVLAPGRDGVVRAYATDSGKLIWDLKVAGEYEGVNGVRAIAGSFGAPGVVPVDGMLYMAAGHWVIGGPPGNAVLAYGLE